MKHLEASTKFDNAQSADAAAVKYSVVQRFRGAFHVETVGDGNESFAISATGKGGAYRCMINVMVKADSRKARVIVEGQTEMTVGAIFFYCFSVLLILVLGLFPGSVDTTSEGGAIDTLVFLMIGGFIVYDINRKMAEPQVLVERLLRSVESEFG